jgi:hypothetical protein
MRWVGFLVSCALLFGCAGGDGSGPGGAGPASQLAFTVQPSASTVGQAIVPPVQVSIQDASGNLVSSAGNAVTVTLGAGPKGATLSGTTTVNAASGVATFSDLRSSKAGTGYTLLASASGLTGATSAAFDVAEAPGAAAAMRPVAGNGQTATVGQAVETSPSVRVTDGLGAPVTDVSVTFSVAAGGGSGDSGDIGGQAPAVVTDTYGNLIPGVTMRFVVTSGGGKVTGAVQPTGIDGIATVGSWTVGDTPGPNTLSASQSSRTARQVSRLSGTPRPESSTTPAMRAD